jgi:ABC-type uncharacterized transport system permease subunit
VTVVTGYLATLSTWVNGFGAFAWVIVGLLAGLLLAPHVLAFDIFERQLQYPVTHPPSTLLNVLDSATR